jgi:hypothetical protein
LTIAAGRGKIAGVSPVWWAIGTAPRAKEDIPMGERIDPRQDPAEREEELDETSEEEVEGHRRPRNALDESPELEDDGDDVEGHRRPRNA